MLLSQGRPTPGTASDSKSYPNVFEDEFTDNNGRAFASLALPAKQLLVLHYEPVERPDALSEFRKAKPTAPVLQLVEWLLSC